MGTWIHDFLLFAYAFGAHWASLLTGGFVMAVVGIYEHRKNRNLHWESYVFIAVIFCLYSVFAAWQDEHRNTGDVIADKRVLSSRVEDCSFDLRTSRSSLRDKDSLATALQNTLVSLQGPAALEQANITTCINTLAKMNPKIHEQINVIGIPFGSFDALGRFVKQAVETRTLTELLIITNEPETRFHGFLKCENEFSFITAPALITTKQTAFSSKSLPIKLDNGEWEITVQAGGDWAPANPAYMQIETKEANPGQCSFRNKF